MVLERGIKKRDSQQSIGQHKMDNLKREGDVFRVTKTRKLWNLRTCLPGFAYNSYLLFTIAYIFYLLYIFGKIHSATISSLYWTGVKHIRMTMWTIFAHHFHMLSSPTSTSTYFFLLKQGLLYISFSPILSRLMWRCTYVNDAYKIPSWYECYLMQNKVLFSFFGMIFFL